MTSPARYLLLVMCARFTRCGHIGGVAIGVNGEVALDLHLREKEHPKYLNAGFNTRSEKATKDNSITEPPAKLKDPTNEDDTDLSVETEIKKLRHNAPKRPVDETTDISKENELNAERERIENITVAPLVECQYQFPEQKHMETMLGSMMNQLTKIFTRMQGILQQEDARRSQETRFRVVSKAANGFFDDIYGNMTDEYKAMFNSTTQEMGVSSGDLCAQQPQLQRVWLELLQQSQAALRRAARRCVGAYLAQRGRRAGAAARARVRRALRTDLRAARAAHLAELCADHQLCYDDLL